MFFLEVQKPPISRSKLPKGVRSVRKNGLLISYFLGKCYSFCSELGNDFIIGESLTTVSKPLIQKLLKNVGDLQTFLSTDGRNILDLVIVRTERKTIHVAESISSCRPVYYQAGTKKFICFTELKYAQSCGVELVPRDDIIPELFVYRFILPPKTLYEGINKLIGGQSIEYDFENNSVVENELWRFGPTGKAHSVNVHFALKEIRSCLTNNINDVIAGYKTPGILLSGGLDSTLLAAIAKSGGAHFSSASSSFRFMNGNDSENRYASTVADHLKTDHKIFTATPEVYLSGLVEAIYVAEEPVHHLQTVMLYLLFKELASSGNDLLLCGEGADSLFGNDTHVRYLKYRNLIKATRSIGILGLYRKVLGQVVGDTGRFGFFTHSFGREIRNRTHLLISLGQYGDFELVRAHLNVNDHQIIGSRISLMNEFCGHSLLDRITILLLLSEAYETMTIWSKLAESQGISISYPFVSPELIDIVTALPWKLKLRENKYIIRSLLREEGIPEEFIIRPKKSFGFPSEFWALQGQLFQPIVDMANQIHNSNFLIQLQVNDQKRAMILWNVINHYIWHRLFIDGVKPDDLSGEIVDRFRRQGRSRT